VTDQFDHRPVLLEESLTCMALAPGSIVLDGTLGGGGHSEAVLQRTAPDGRVIGLDLDDDALMAARARLRPFGDRFQCVKSSFRYLDDVLHSLSIERVDAVLLDLGVSSHQLDEPGRGFRFALESADTTPLDMRMDQTGDGETAAELLQRANADELHKLFERYGELPGSKRLARAIVDHRRSMPLRTSADLLQVIDAARIGGGRKHNPATLVFQALRIAVNDELAALEEGIDAALAVLRPGGRLVILAYHSLEDRIVKQRFRQEARGCVCPPKQPVCTCGRQPRVRVVTRRPVRASDSEIETNPRARSVRLRAAERIAEAA
jgi:16S rRNA (cytosine1402-N4)-methyltransferase